jgi:hypothetical protein
MGSPHWGVYNPPQRGVPTGACTLPNGDSPISLGVSRIHKAGYAKIGYMRSTWDMNNIFMFVDTCFDICVKLTLCFVP